MIPTKEQIEADILHVKEHGLETAFDLQATLFALKYLKLSMDEPSKEVYTTVGRACSNFMSGQGEYPIAKHVINRHVEVLLTETEEALNE